MKENANQQANKPTPVEVFNAKILGSSLQEVAVEFIKSEGLEIESRWFHSKKDADFFIWSDHRKNIVKQQVTYYGQVIEWNIIDGLRTGVLVEDEKSQQMGSSPIIQYDLTPQFHTVTQCIQLIHFIPNLLDTTKSQVIYNFTQSQQPQSRFAYNIKSILIEFAKSLRQILFK